MYTLVDCEYAIVCTHLRSLSNALADLLRWNRHRLYSDVDRDRCAIVHGAGNFFELRHFCVDKHTIAFSSMQVQR